MTQSHSVGQKELICSEAVEQAVASGAFQVVLAAAAIGAAREMRQDFDASSSRNPLRSIWPTIAGPVVLLLQLWQVSVGRSCPRPWKNASEEAVDALGFAGMTVEIPVELADACGLSEAIRF